MAFEITCKDGPSAARCGVLSTPHGPVRTPAFMPVGTQGSVKAMHPRDLEELGADIVLGNTYHLSLRPGAELIRSLGGLHSFIGWQRAILTDSGGFQIYSMQGRHRVLEEGVRFNSHLDGSEHLMTPESCVRNQLSFGSDIIMVLDHCLPYPAPTPVVREATELTCRWAARSLAEYRRVPGPAGGALFGIQQGGFDPRQRRACAERLAELDFAGHAVGGLSVGEPKELLLETAALCAPMLPDDRPRYLMGVGPPDDLLTMIGLGYDLFDCVLPTRNARTGTLFTSRGRLSIKHAHYRNDPSPIDPECGCSVCSRFSRAYLRHLFVSGEILASMLNTHHNLHFFLTLLARAREAIAAGRFTRFRDDFIDGFRQRSSLDVEKKST